MRKGTGEGGCSPRSHHPLRFASSPPRLPHPHHIASSPHSPSLGWHCCGWLRFVVVLPPLSSLGRNHARWVEFAVGGLNLPCSTRRAWAPNRCRLVGFTPAALDSPSLAHSTSLAALDSLSLIPVAGVGFNSLRLNLLDMIGAVSALRGWRVSVRWKEKE